MHFSSDRSFQIWDYNVSHRQLLLRSPQTPEIFTNIDVAFWGVTFIDISSSLDGLSLSRAADDDFGNSRRWPARPAGGVDVYRLVSGGVDYRVAASGFRVLENRLDIFESSLMYPSRDLSGEQLGKVLATSLRP